MNGDTPGSFGGPAQVTPAIDQLAREGMSFRRAHVPIAICQPSRSAMMTGRWPHRNGAEGFEPIHDDVPLLTDLLRPAGYRFGILGKVDHLAPVERFGWDTVVPQRELGLGRDPALYAASAKAFIDAAVTEQRPWFLMANAHDPHRPFHGSAAEQAGFPADVLSEVPAPSHVFAPGDWPVPGFLPDLPEARLELAEYLSSSRRCDDVVKAVLTVLEESGQADHTLVVFLSDNGMAFPFAKANCYLHGTRTPLIVRWPGRTIPGTQDTGHFVSALDLFPTFCEAASIPVPAELDGQSLAGILAGAIEPQRDHICTVFHENWAKNRFEMRCIQNGSHGYIWNAWANGRTAYQAEHMGTLTWEALVRAAPGDPAIDARREFYLQRQPEELYDITDVDSLTDLTAQPEKAPVLAAFRRQMLQWLTESDDPLREQYEKAFGGSPASP